MCNIIDIKYEPLDDYRKHIERIEKSTKRPEEYEATYDFEKSLPVISSVLMSVKDLPDFESVYESFKMAYQFHPGMN